MTDYPAHAAAADATGRPDAVADATPSAPAGASAAHPLAVDPVTQVQDAIDGLSLSIFEALRGLRDAVAPYNAQEGEDGGGDVGQRQRQMSLADEPDYDEFLISYHNEDPQTLAVVESAGGKVPKGPEEYFKLLSRIDREGDQALVTRLAEDILAKSHALNGLVDSMPGMGRTREEQMRRIEELMGENRNLEEELVAVYQEAEETRDALRKRLRDVTSAALGIEEEG